MIFISEAVGESNSIMDCTPLLPERRDVEDPSGMDEETEGRGSSLLSSDDSAGTPDGAADADSSKLRLSRSLQVLFFLNGMSLSLPILAQMFIVNSRVGVPVKYLSAYGATAFLPCSLKPLYAYLSQNFSRRHLLTILYACNGMFLASSAFIPSGGVGWCFLLGFLRSITNAWPEFLLSITLIGEAKYVSSRSTSSRCYEEVVAKFQTEDAATCRSLGSLLADLVTFCIFLYRHYLSRDTQTELSDSVVSILFFISGGLAIVASVVSSTYNVKERIDNHNRSTSNDDLRGAGQSYSERDPLLDVNETSYRSTSVTPSSTSIELKKGSFGGKSFILVAILQVIIISYAIRVPLVDLTSVVTWNLSMLVLFGALLFFIMTVQWKASHRVGIYLILNHSVPSCDYVMSSYIYGLFQSFPAVLQGLSLVRSVSSTLSCWSYGRLFAKFSSGFQLRGVIVLTTVLTAFVSLSNIILVYHHASVNFMAFVLVIVAIATTFVSEWKFLPSIVLAATNALKSDDVDEAISTAEQRMTELPGTPYVSQDDPDLFDNQEATTYGTLLSCIDFGGQIGAWVLVPLVSSLGINRENDWKNLGLFIVLCSIAKILSLALLPLIPRK